MSLRTPLLRRVTTLAAGLALTAGLVGTVGTAPVGAAQAEPGHAPVAVEDVVEVYAGTVTPVDVLANDTDADGDELAICRLGPVPRRLEVGIDGSQLIIVPKRLEAGTFTFTYYACDFGSLSPATVTVHVLEQPKVRVRVRKTDRPGQLRVTNRGDFGLSFLWGSAQEDDADGQVQVPRRSSALVEVQRRSLIWIAYNGRRQAFRLGVVRGIELPRGSMVLPPGAPDEDLAGLMTGRPVARDWALRWASR